MGSERETRYSVVVEPDGRGWIAYHPDLDGCVASGDDIDEALNELDYAREAWISYRRENGLSVPDPSTHRVVPLDASPSDVVVLSREDAALLHYVAKSWWALFGNSPRKIGKNTAWRALQAIRSAIDREHAE